MILLIAVMIVCGEDILNAHVLYPFKDAAPASHDALTLLVMGSRRG